jgi:peptidoglycan/LPS O-acetylase OafA/YrhL
MKNKIFFPNLDGLRFLAFFLVFWQHTSSELFTLLKNRGIAGDLQSQFFITGGFGVSFFFVLSGFLITYLLLQEIKDNGAINIKAFYIRRVLRIFPLYYFVLFFGFAIYPYLRQLLKMPALDNGNFFLYAFFLGNFDLIYAIDRSMFVGITWSVGIEEQFYIFWALLFLLLPKYLFKYLFPVIIVVSCLFRFYNHNDGKIEYFHTLSVVSDLAVGGGLAYLTINKPNVVGFFNRLRKSYIILIYLLGFILIWFYPSLFWLNQISWMQRLVFSLFFAFIIAEQNYAEHSFYKMKNFKIISKLGIYTYGLYLLHPIALYILDIALRFLKFDQTSFIIIMLNGSIGLCLSIFISYISYELFESRFLRLKRYFRA